MKASFHTRLLNSPFEDPGLYVRLLRERRALLFDAGSTAALSTRDILKISDIFISHTHVDHFIGFDSLLRLHLGRDRPLKLYGPPGIIDQVEGRLRGYTWNITADYPLVIEVSEVDDDAKKIKKATFMARESFRRRDRGEVPFEGIILRDSFFRISTTVLDHQIPCLAFALEEDYHINIDKAKLERLNLPVGPWLGELKTAIREKREESVFTIEGKEFSFSELRHIAHITKGQKISYVVDTIGSRENIEKIIDLVRGSDILFIEAYFLERDKDRAMERYHLTAKEAGRIAREAGVGRMEVFHFSPKYTETPDMPAREAQEEFRRG